MSNLYLLKVIRQIFRRTGNIIPS